MEFADFIAIGVFVLGGLSAAYAKYGPRALPIVAIAQIAISCLLLLLCIWNAAMHYARFAAGSVDAPIAIQHNVRTAIDGGLVPMPFVIATCVFVAYLAFMPRVVNYLKG